MIDNLDVLFSFLGLYAIGVCVFNVDKIRKTKNKLYVNDGKRNSQILCSELFFSKYFDWYEVLINKYSNAFIEDLNLKQERYNSLYTFWDSVNQKDEYIDYIKNAVLIISKRTELINAWIKKNC